MYFSVGATFCSLRESLDRSAAAQRVLPAGEFWSNHKRSWSKSRSRWGLKKKRRGSGFLAGSRSGRCAGESPWASAVAAAKRSTWQGGRRWGRFGWGIEGLDHEQRTVSFLWRRIGKFRRPVRAMELAILLGFNWSIPFSWKWFSSFKQYSPGHSSPGHGLCCLGSEISVKFVKDVPILHGLRSAPDYFGSRSPFLPSPPRQANSSFAKNVRLLGKSIAWGGWPATNLQPRSSFPARQAPFLLPSSNSWR
jgi:hypothetical protein